MPPPPWTTATRDPPPPPSRAAVWCLRLVRLPMIVGIVSVFAAATALLAFSAVQAYLLIERLVAGDGTLMTKEELMLASMKLVDLVLLATVLHIMAVGLYGLFIDRRLPVPPWLRIRNIDTLKHRLTGVVITLLGIVFLEHVTSWDGQRDLLTIGIAVAIVVVALSYFLSVPIRPDKTDES